MWEKEKNIGVENGSSNRKERQEERETRKSHGKNLRRKEKMNKRISSDKIL